MSDYLPSRESALSAFCANLSTKLMADPPGYGQTEAEAQDYLDVQTAFATAYAVANDPATRTSVNIVAKNTAKKALVAATRPLVQTLQNWSGMTDKKREDLQIPLRDTEPTPVPVPEEMPKLSVKMVRGNRLYLELLNQENEKRKPVGARSAWLYSWVGESPSPDLTQWEFRGETTRSDPDLDFPLSVGPDTEVWVTALWVSPTGKPGPACAPVNEYTNRMGMNQAA